MSCLTSLFLSLCNIVDSEPMMEETILVGEDLMLGPPSPLIPKEIASHVLEGVDLCDGILRNLFLCKFFFYFNFLGLCLIYCSVYITLETRC